MDEEAIVILIEIRQMVQAVRAIRIVAEACKSMSSEVRQQASAATKLAQAWDRVARSVKRVGTLPSIALPSGAGGRGATGGGSGFGSRLRLMAGQNGITPRLSLAAFALNPYMIAIAAATVAVGAMAKAAGEAGAALTKIGLTAGGTAAQTAQLSVLGTVAGTDLASMARQFAETISHGGTAGGFAARAGIHDFGIFDSTNKAKKLMDWLDYMGRLSPEEAMRAARATHTEELLFFRMLSEKTRQNLILDAARIKRLGGADFQRTSAEFNASLKRLNVAFTALEIAAGRLLLPTLTKVIDKLTEFVNALADGLKILAPRFAHGTPGTTEIYDLGKFLMDIGKFGRKIVEAGSWVGKQIYDFFALERNALAPVLEWFRNFTVLGKNLDFIWKAIKTTTDFFGWIIKWFADLGAKMFGKDKDAHTQALEDNTRALEDAAAAYAQNGTYGGGERARGAVPSKWSGMNTERYISEASRLGAFAY